MVQYGGGRTKPRLHALLQALSAPPRSALAAGGPDVDVAVQEALAVVAWREGGLGPAYAPGAGYLRGGVDERKYQRPAMASSVLGLEPAELDTPCLTVDLAVLERNIQTMHTQCRQLGISVRAHFKAHKMPMIALRQAAAGASFACQKLGEAEVLLRQLPQADVMIPYNIVGPQKLRRLAELICGYPHATICVSADSHAVVVGLAKAVRHANRLRTYQLANKREDPIRARGRTVPVYPLVCWWSWTRARSAAARSRHGRQWTSPRRSQRRLSWSCWGSRTTIESSAWWASWRRPEGLRRSVACGCEC